MPENIDRLTLVLCLTIGAVILLNAAIIAYFRRGGSSPSELKVFKKLMKESRDPFSRTDKEYQELSKLVDQFKQNKSGVDEGAGKDGGQNNNH